MLCALIFLPHSAFAASKLADQRNVIFDRYTTEHGLSHAAITAITQDHYGFMWIGTQEGLNRFDGYKFQNFYHRDDVEGSISNNSINALLTDSDGVVWVGTDDGLNRLTPDRSKFQKVSLGQEPELVVSIIFESTDKTIWVGTQEGLFYLDGKGTAIRAMSAKGELDTASIRDIFQDNAGVLWVATDHFGILKQPEKNREFTQVAVLRHLSIRDIVQDTKGELWLGGNGGSITIYNAKNERVRSYNGRDAESGLETSRVRAILTDTAGAIWVGTAHGLHLFDSLSDTFTKYTHDDTDPHSISDNNVLNLYQDRGGVIWIATFNGLSKFNAETNFFPGFRKATNSGLESDATTSFAEGNNSDVWIGTFGGLHKWDGKASKFRHFSSSSDGLSDNRIMSLKQIGEELWIGTMTSGINIFENDELVALMQHDELDPNSISSNAISGFHHSNKGEVWVSTYGGGVNRYIGDGRFERFPKPGQKDGRFSNTRTLGITSGPNNKLWIATDGGGVVILDPESGETEIHRHDSNNPESISSDNITSILNSGNSVWVGTRDNGLNQYIPQTKTFRTYNRTSGLASDLVYGILADKDGSIWVSGGKGLSVLNPNNGNVKTYDSTHGLQSDDFNSGAYLELSDGTFLFGGNNGFNAFYPERVKQNEYVAPVRITQFSRFNEPIILNSPVYETDSIELDHNDSVFGFEFAVMDYTAPRKNRFRYRLEGFDRRWTEPTDSHQVTYTNLDPGNYRFSVQGANNDGVWNEVGTSIGITVKPPIWATWWAYAIYFVVALVLVRQALEANQARLRREAEKRYNERLQLYIESLEEATDTVLIADANKNLLYANNSIEESLGISPEHAEGRPIMSLLFSDPEDARQARDGIQSQGRWHGEIIGRKGTETVTTDVTITAVKDENENETAFVCIARDITQRKKVEAELEVHRENLQSLVDERTTALKHEIAENKAVQRELANSLEEKELLLKEVHHRVKNNMQVISSLLNIQAETVNDDIFSGLLGESQQRIKSMSLIHENLYQSDNLLEIDFEDYINMLANSLHRFYRLPDVIVSLDIRVFNVALDIETAVPCGLIINELISNAFKHAFKGRTGKGCISIVFKQSETEYVLKISDDGNGLPEGFSLDTQSSMGTEIVVILTHQLDGEISFSSTDGACFEIRFPKKEIIHQAAAQG